jgi:uncharacterized OsmC-like protein
MSEQIRDAIETLKLAVVESPAVAKVVFSASTVSAADAFSTDSTVRGFGVRHDEPPELGGADTGPNPVEAVLAALGSCQAIVYRAYANALGLRVERVERVEVETRGHLDVRGFLGDPAVPAGFQRVTFSTRVVSLEPAEKIDDLARLVEAHCPVLDILRTPLAVSGTLEHVTTAAARDAA